MYTSVDFSSQIVAWRGSLVPQTRGSHTPIWCLVENLFPPWRLPDLKNRLLLLLTNLISNLITTLKIYYYYIIINIINKKISMISHWTNFYLW
jgi:hypothetical protein